MRVNTAYQTSLRMRSVAESRSLADTKRFLETYLADPDFRAACHSGDRCSLLSVMMRYGMRDLDPDAIAPLWQNGFDAPVPPSALSGYPLAQQWASLVGFRMSLRNDLRSSADVHVVDEAVKTWRQLQVTRAASTLNPGFLEANVYPLFAIELSDGCSVRCPFCGVGAGGLKNIFSLTSENLILFRNILRELKSFFGDQAGAFGFLYWATDPLDNPSYEEFSAAYCDELGYIPQITTALAARNLERTAALLPLLEVHRIAPHRFSILSIGQLRRIYERFAPLDLLEVEIIPQNRGSLLKKARAGKNRGPGDSDLDGESIACVAGFLINLVQKTVKLISPCPASAKYPLGYRVHGEAGFSSASNFSAVLRSIRHASMEQTLSADAVIHLWDELDTTDFQRTAVLNARYRDFDLSHDTALRALVSHLIEAGKCTVREAVQSSIMQGEHVLNVVSGVRRLRAEGLLDIA